MAKEINYPKQYGNVIGRVTALISFMIDIQKMR